MNNADHIFSCLSEIAYSDQPHPVLPPGNHFVEFFRDERRSVEVLCTVSVVERDGRPQEHLVFSHAGTESGRDLATDLDFCMVTLPFGRMHGGGWEYYNAAREWMLDMVSDHSCGRIITHTGHSLGGLSAAGAALDMQTDLVSFGCPVPGDRQLIAAITQLSQQNYVARYYFATDPIVWAPGAMVNARFGTSYYWGPWRANGVCLGIGRHPVRKYKAALA